MKNNVFSIITLLCIGLMMMQCKEKSTTLFRLVSAEETEIEFVNKITENDTFNILTQEYIYNGGGVGIADFNNDGLQDIFFAGNLVPNQLYLNKGKFRFQDVTAVANVNVNGRWNSGVAVVDINNDGWMDIYVCATMRQDSTDRRNMLFINGGLNKDGIPTFVEKASDYKIDDDGYSVNAAFLDYDRDGDLDLYVLTNQRLDNLPTNYRAKLVDGSSPNNDKFYRNNGDGTFTNVTKEAGITIEGFGLGLSVADFNLDGWPDIYVSNDYLSNDILYINSGHGTFKNKIADFVGHQSQFSMGNDAADINNDGMPDIITLDMLPETNNRKKTTIGGKSYLTYINNEKFHYEYQYVRNMVHLNNGLNYEIKFSEIGQLAGVHQTEWSWSPLFADFDNDGYKDLIITNGFPKDITDKDFSNYRAEVGNVASPALLVDSIPIVKIPNYAFKNNGDLTFKDVSATWGLDHRSFSNGAAFADLDNDGDLDYVVNNINDKAFVYENTLYSSIQKEEPLKENYLTIKLKGSKNNMQGIGAKVTLYNKNGLQYYEHSIYRGFLSSVDQLAHFGLGNFNLIDSIIVIWPDGNAQRLKDINANQTVTIDYSSSTKQLNQKSTPSQPEKLFKESTNRFKINYRHIEDDVIDFNLQRTLPHKFSQSGPGISVGDLNGDGLDDFVMGGSIRHHTTTFIQNQDGSFRESEKDKIDENKKQEDEGLLLFDADNDGDLDLYVVSGGIEGMKSDENYQDRLYKKDGKGKFELDANALPQTQASGSCVRAADYDADGDLDLFVGGRVMPGSYPYPAESYLLENNKGSFTDVTSGKCAMLKTPGMVTDALWTDFDNDEKVDLIVVGEFMSISFFKNEGNKFSKLNSTGIEKETGWWNSITSGDYDRDGDIDYIIGNLGQNNSYQVTKDHPLQVCAKDFDGNGSVDPVMACYLRESMDTDIKKLYPVHFWDELNSQSPKFRNKYSYYRQYAKASLEDLLTKDDLKDAMILKANTMTTSYVENLGKGKFRITALPSLVQVAPVNGMVTDDVDADGDLDVIMVGNDYGNEVFVGRYDAFTGLVLLGDGHGKFNVEGSAKTGFYVPGDAKAIATLYSAKGEELFIATQNKDSVKVFTKSNLSKTHAEIVSLNALDTWAEFIYEDGRKARVEFYYGSGYLSQSGRKIELPDGLKEVIIYDSRGQARRLTKLHSK